MAYDEAHLIVRDWLKKMKLTKKDLAEKMPDGIPSYKTIEGFVDRGKGGTLAVGYAIAQALGLTLSDIYVKRGSEQEHLNSRYVLESEMALRQNILPEESTLQEYRGRKQPGDINELISSLE